jgi:hypothetical protein
LCGRKAVSWRRRLLWRWQVLSRRVLMKPCKFAMTHKLEHEDWPKLNYFCENLQAEMDDKNHCLAPSV